MGQDSVRERCVGGPISENAAIAKGVGTRWEARFALQPERAGTAMSKFSEVQPNGDPVGCHRGDTPVDRVPEREDAAHPQS
jgi:hypothetical protein